MQIYKYRADGWPLCPNCGEDELWSKLIWQGAGECPPIAHYIKAGLSCYRCGWSNEPPIITYEKVRSQQ